MSGVLALAVLLAAIEIALQNDWLPLPRVHVIHFAMPLVFTVIGIRLIQMFVHALGVAETVNEQLERRVAQKSSEIEHGYAELAALREREAARQERYRIAADLHDDLGARLLAIAQTAPSDAVASMAREALDEMRLSVRGMTGEAARAIDVLADWRAETVSRLAAAGFEADWDAQEPSRRLILPSRTHVQLTRVLREAVSNVIRHSGGRRCHVRVAFEPPGLCLTIEDDGQGLPAGPRPATGHGLPNIERRVRKLEGTQVFSTSALGGARLQVCVPLETTPSSANMPSHELRPDR
jgi:signal transduction histidine kinase